MKKNSIHKTVCMVHDSKKKKKNEVISDGNDKSKWEVRSQWEDGVNEKNRERMNMKRGKMQKKKKEEKRNINNEGGEKWESIEGE